MNIFELILIFALSIFQSIFGVGLLVFGTPAFLLIGYSFFDIINILLPFSIIISLFQIIYTKETNRDFQYKLIIYCVPSLILSLIFLINYESRINFIILMSLTIIFFSLVNLIKVKDIFLSNNRPGKTKVSLVLLGIIHGLTNLGGSFLTLIAANMSTTKISIRYNIASGYLVLGVIQLLFVNLFHSTLNIQTLYYLFIPVLCFFIAM
tara:strand:- start:26 stop:649 length:624 start_codon:yes stop_codon:yes gene_type:complete